MTLKKVKFQLDDKKNTLLTFIFLFIIIIIIIIFVYFVRYFKLKLNIYESFDNNGFKYYRCENKILGQITKRIFDENDIKHSNEEWNIYVPCGYNEVEEELKKILVKGDPSKKYIFGINGCDTIVSKNKIWESLANCYGRKEASRLMPESYVLNDIEELQTFMQDFNIKDNNIYILKKNIQRKEGLKLTRDYDEILNGWKDDYRVAQKYITNLFLINGYKVNLRIYLLIVIRDNKITFYLSNKGKCIYTNKKYNDNDLDFESNITSYNLDMSIYNKNPRDFVQLRKYIDNNILDIPNAGNYFFKKIDSLMTKISKCLANNLYQSKNIKGSVTFQLFGCDVIFTDDLHPYLLEMNKGPDMIPRDDIDEDMKSNIQIDMFRKVGILNKDNYRNISNSFYKIFSI
jgi:hypothetical protein